MAILFNCQSFTTKPQILASSALPNDDSPSPSPSQNPILKPININNNNKLPKTNYVKLQSKLKQPKQQQPSVLEIERAIGAGIFRDRDNYGEEKEETKTSLFDNLLSNSVGKSEGSVEKQLRETGEWLVYQTENTTRSAGKQILVSMFVWVIPMWIFSFLVAIGVIPLPFDAPFLKDLFL
ncbi:hypothetical protein ABFS83_12G063600 [Erythranthe nasuta]